MTCTAQLPYFDQPSWSPFSSDHPWCLESYKSIALLLTYCALDEQFSVFISGLQLNNRCNKTKAIHIVSINVK